MGDPLTAFVRAAAGKLGRESERGVFMSEKFSAPLHEWRCAFTGCEMTVGLDWNQQGWHFVSEVRRVRGQACADRSRRNQLEHAGIIEATDDAVAMICPQHWAELPGGFDEPAEEVDQPEDQPKKNSLSAEYALHYFEEEHQSNYTPWPRRKEPVG